MACTHKLKFLVYITLFSLRSQKLVNAEPQVPCYFVFGDSLADIGNNNGLKTMAKANFPPYGIDFPYGPTGRFTNGRNYADVIGELLGFKNSITPYATAKGLEIIKGVNYASGGSGILPETGRNIGQRFSLEEQLNNHNFIVKHITEFQGNNKKLTEEHLNKCMYIVGMGSNDYLNNYLMPQLYPSNRLYTPDQFAEKLIKKYSRQLKTLYNHGARKVAVFGLGNVGCTPAVIGSSKNPDAGCVEVANTAVKLFNDRLTPLVDHINSKHSDAKFIYVNTTHISSGNPLLTGITVLTPCCKVSTNYREGQCVANQAPCIDRDTHAFFDAFHPTEKAVLPIAMRAYRAQTHLDVYPMDIRGLAWFES